MCQCVSAVPDQSNHVWLVIHWSPPPSPIPPSPVWICSLPSTVGYLTWVAVQLKEERVLPRWRAGPYRGLRFKESFLFFLKKVIIFNEKLWKFTKANTIGSTLSVQIRNNGCAVLWTFHFKEQHLSRSIIGVNTCTARPAYMSQQIIKRQIRAVTALNPEVLNCACFSVLDGFNQNKPVPRKTESSPVSTYIYCW